ncbi:tRNA lysidine(34) synthetase TilS [Clostridium oryzae]|uniref:tRNA(Ile)-lysidine synthase n=1 Tax=Clostridium oryzae TaxID=1450648 RepID=A0A1V4IM11_9CLOT|nr:tRNA lysidine(34) synthetase TilS [Clostridium oryzae]OPJ61068.1 tRNA(Ile)-lysidine synthase [Clostridium oryzae]
MINKVKKFVDKHDMIQSGDKIIVALSGGPDSICLMHILNGLKKQFNLTLYAAHVNHCLRGKEADEDEEYVKNFCRKIGVDIFTKRVDVNAIAKRDKVSSETAGRNARYEFFYELKDKLQADKIAIAHNKNDQAETILMRLMRGTSIEGLKGIRPIRDEIFIRPILFLSREEIERYCAENDLKPRIDRTNSENIYNRNRVRLDLIPYIKENFNPDIVETLYRFSDSITRDENFIEIIAKEKYNSLCSNRNGHIVIDNRLKDEHEAIATRIIRLAIHKVYGSLKDIDSVHIYEVLSLLSLGTGRKINLPKGIVCENVYGDLHIGLENNRELNYKSEYNICEKNDLAGGKKKSVFISEAKITVNLEVKPNDKQIDFDNEVLTKYFDYDKISYNVTVRYRREGDRLCPLGMKGSKKLKDLFMDLKIPKEYRNSIPLLCFDDEIAWVLGYRVSNKFAVTKDTNNILEVKIVKGE